MGFSPWIGGFIMMTLSYSPRRLVAALAVTLCAATTASAQSQEPFVPQVGQAGKDVVWVPTPPELVERMLELAEVTPQDFVIDLGSGDGRNVIAAAKRGARARGVEYNPDMVAISTRNAVEAGVADRATFVEGDMYQADISEANVLALFLLPSNMLQLRQKFFDLQPGSRIVANTFGIEGWTEDERVTIEGDCNAWCTALLWIVPAKVAGTWQLPQGTLTLTQEFQMISGTLGSMPITGGRLRGQEITFSVGTAVFDGRVQGDTMSGRVTGGIGGVFSGTRQ